MSAGRVLVAEDDGALRELLMELLAGARHEVPAVSGGIETLPRLRRMNPSEAVLLPASEILRLDNKALYRRLTEDASAREIEDAMDENAGGAAGDSVARDVPDSRHES